jgi:hypothetical protein
VRFFYAHPDFYYFWTPDKAYRQEQRKCSTRQTISAIRTLALLDADVPHIQRDYLLDSVDFRKELASDRACEDCDG